MTAFGPFANKTEIDFSLFNQHSLFLITGPTGSGKTTILDAITFALFGESSGDSRQSENFKSDYCDLSSLCFVCLDFELRGKKYTIERSPKQQKKSARKDADITINAKARLILDNNEELTGVENVNKKISELFGITYKQFKQIIILPQGEFRRLLEASSEEKQEIFRKIFGTDIYEKFCKALSEKTKAIVSKIENIKLLINSYVSSIDSSGSEELKNSVSSFLLETDKINLKALLDILKENIALDEKTSAEMKNSIDLIENEKNNINLKLSNLKILEDKTLRLSSLESKLKSAKNLNENLNIKLKDISSQFENIAQKKDDIPRLLGEKNNLTEQLNYYENINNAITQYSSLVKKHAQILQNIKKTSLAENKLSLAEEIKSQSQLLSILKNLIISIDVYKNVFDEYKLAESSYITAYENFLSGQAGFLASKLAANEPCPVCGSVSHPNKATLQKDTPSESAVNQLALKTKNLRDKVANLDVELSKNFSKIKDLIPDLNDIEYENIISSKDKLSSIFEDQKIFIDEKTKTMNDIKIDITGLSLPDIQNYKQKYNNESISLSAKIDSLKNKIEEDKSKLPSEANEETTKQKLKDIDCLINSINNQYKILYSEHLKIKTLFDQNLQEISLLSAEIIDLKQYLSSVSINISEESSNLSTKMNSLNEKLSTKRNEYSLLNAKLNLNLKQLDNINSVNSQYEKLMDSFSDFASLSEIAAGKNPQRISFERYILASYFQDVIDAANIKFSEMTNYRYLLKRKQSKEKNNRSSGLDLEIIDNYTGKERHINTLSGGESFKASLCLALGLAEVVQMNSGGVEIDTLFIDEGFGTLDSESLDITMDALNSLKKTGRLIGIISHVNELKERIPAQLVIKPSKSGSYLSR